MDNDNWETFLAGSDDGSVDPAQSPNEGPMASLGMFATDSSSCDLTEDTSAVEGENRANDVEYNLLGVLPDESIRLTSVDTNDIMDLMDPTEHISNSLSEIKQSSSPSSSGSGEKTGKDVDAPSVDKNIPRPLPLIISDSCGALGPDPGIDSISNVESLNGTSCSNNNLSVSSLPSPSNASKKRAKWSLDVNLSNACGNNVTESLQGISNLTMSDATDRKSDQSVSSQVQIERNLYWQTRKSVKISVRVRPPSVQEMESKFTRVVSMANDNNEDQDRVCILNPTVASIENPDDVAAGISNEQVPEWARVFDDMDHCFWSYGPVETKGVYVNQRGIHDAIGAEMVYHAWNGMSSTCVCYGQTNSGKSHTLFGSIIPNKMYHLDSPPVQDNDYVTVSDGKYGKYKVLRETPKKNSSHSNNNFSFASDLNTNLNMKASLLEESVGLVPRVFKDLILKVARNNGNEPDTKCILSFYEIYNDKIRDLLADDSNLHGPHGQKERELKQREHPIIGPYIEGLKKFPVVDVNHMLQLVSKGNRNRNYNPSDGRAFYHTRSHAVVVLELVPISQWDPVYGDYIHPRVVSLSVHRGNAVDFSDHRCVKVQMVELAGPEKSSPGSVNVLEKLEANKIGTSLSTLSRVIHSLSKTHSYYSGSKLRASSHKWDVFNANISMDTSLAVTSDSDLITGEEAVSYRHYQSQQRQPGFTVAKSPSSASNTSKLPYRESLLTWLLKDGFSDRSGVRGFVSCIATISPAGSCYEESLQTLHYAHRLCYKAPFPALDMEYTAPSKLKREEVAYPPPVTNIENAVEGSLEEIVFEEANGEIISPSSEVALVGDVDGNISHYGVALHNEPNNADITAPVSALPGDHDREQVEFLVTGHDGEEQHDICVDNEITPSIVMSENSSRCGDADNLRLLNAEIGRENVSHKLAESVMEKPSLGLSFIHSVATAVELSFIHPVATSDTEKLSTPKSPKNIPELLSPKGGEHHKDPALNTAKAHLELSLPEFGSPSNILGSPSSAVVRDTYRELHSRLVEMQIELQNTKTDRDSLRVELLGSKETIAILQKKNANLRMSGTPQLLSGSFRGSNASNATTPGLNMNIGEEFGAQYAQGPPKSHTKAHVHGLNNADNIDVRSSLDGSSDESEDLQQSVLYLKGLIARKEITIEELLSEIKEERRFRESAEKLNETQMLDFLERVDSLRRLSDEANNEMKRIHDEETEALVAANEEISRKLVEMGEKLVAVEHGLSDEDKWDRLRQDYANTARSLKSARESAIFAAENDRNRLKVDANVPLSDSATITMVSSPQKSPAVNDPAAYAELLKKYQSLYDKHISLGVCFNQLKEFSPSTDNLSQNQTPNGNNSIHYKALGQLQQMLSNLSDVILPNSVSAVSGMSTGEVEVAVQGVNTCFNTVKQQYISLLESKLSEGAPGLTTNPFQVELAYYRDKCLEYESSHRNSHGGGNGAMPQSEMTLKSDNTRLQHENAILSRKLGAAISANSKESMIQSRSRGDDEKERIIRVLREQIDDMKIDRSKLKRHLEKMTKQRDSLQKEIQNIDQDLLRAVRSEQMEDEVLGYLDEPVSHQSFDYPQPQSFPQRARSHSSNLVADRRRNSNRSSTPSETRSKSRSGTPSDPRSTYRNHSSGSASASRSSTPSEIKRVIKPVKATARAAQSVGSTHSGEDDLTTRHYSSVQEMQSVIDRKVALSFLRNGDIPAEAMVASRPRGADTEYQRNGNPNHNTSGHNSHQTTYGATNTYGSQSQQNAGSERSRSRSSSIRKSGTSVSNMSSLTSSSRGAVEPVRGGRMQHVASFYNKLN